MLTETIFFDTLRQGLWVATITSVPILAAALVAGVAVGLFQALTSIVRGSSGGASKRKSLSERRGPATRRRWGNLARIR